MKAKHRRLVGLVLVTGTLSAAALLALRALDDTLVFFYSPSDVAERGIEPGQAVRLGGLVEEGSVARAGDGLEVRFTVTDGANGVAVAYRGLLPDLFREGQGVVVQGSFARGGRFEATEVLARHDENYMPREVADALREAGTWRGEGEAE